MRLTGRDKISWKQLLFRNACHRKETVAVGGLAEARKNRIVPRGRRSQRQTIPNLWKGEGGRRGKKVGGEAMASCSVIAARGKGKKKEKKGKKKRKSKRKGLNR